MLCLIAVVATSGTMSLFTEDAAGFFSYGNMFDVYAKTDITITNFAVYPRRPAGSVSPSCTLRVWTKQGTYSTSTPILETGWTKVFEGLAVFTSPYLPAPDLGPLFIQNLDLNVPITKGNTQSFTITIDNPCKIRYTEGNALGATYAENNDIAFHEGLGVGFDQFPLYSVFAVRVFNGVIYYQVDVTMSKDPHSRMAHGARADFRGEPDEVFNVLSHKNVSMSVMFEEADFHWSKRLVHGTKIASAYWTLRDADNKTVTVAFTAHNKTEMHASRGFAAALTVSGAPVVVSDSKPYVAAGVSVSAVGRKLVVSAGGWEMSATNSPFPFASLNKGKMLLDIAIKPHYDVEKDPVAPHGLIGQSWDGDDYDYEGARDLDRSAETTTKAQGEGAIEGVIAEYKMSSAFATDFKYSRFGVSTPTPPRDVSKLTGRKIAKGGRPFVASAASAPVDMAETP